MRRDVEGCSDGWGFGEEGSRVLKKVKLLENVPFLLVPSSHMYTHPHPHVHMFSVTRAVAATSLEPRLDTKGPEGQPGEARLNGWGLMSLVSPRISEC